MGIAALNIVLWVCKGGGRHYAANGREKEQNLLLDKVDGDGFV